MCNAAHEIVGHLPSLPMVAQKKPRCFLDVLEWYEQELYGLVPELNEEVLVVYVESVPACFKPPEGGKDTFPIRGVYAFVLWF